MIDKVIEAFEAHEWVREQNYKLDASGHHVVGCCLGAAITIAHREDYQAWNATRKVIRDAIKKKYPNCIGIEQYNDYHAKSKKEILQLLRSIDQ